MFNLITLAALPSVAFSGVWSGKTNIRMLYPNSTALTFMSDYKNKDMSLCDEGSRFSLPLDHPNYEVLASALMMAFASGKQIDFNIDDNQRVCSPTINRVLIFR